MKKSDEDGYSPNKIKSLLKSLNLPYSNNDIEEIKNDLFLKAKELKNKQLTNNVFCIFIDAYHTQIKDENNKIKAILTSNNRRKLLSLLVKRIGTKRLFTIFNIFKDQLKEKYMNEIFTFIAASYLIFKATL